MAIEVFDCSKITYRMVVGIRKIVLATQQITSTTVVPRVGEKISLDVYPVFEGSPIVEGRIPGDPIIFVVDRVIHYNNEGEIQVILEFPKSGGSA